MFISQNENKASNVVLYNCKYNYLGMKCGICVICELNKAKEKYVCSANYLKFPNYVFIMSNIGEKKLIHC